MPPVTLEMAESNLGPKRLVPSYGILHQFVFDAASATQGFSHKALLAINEANIAQAKDPMMPTETSATKSPANLSSWKEVIIIFSWSAPSWNDFSILMAHPEITLATAAVVIAGLQAPPAVEYAFLFLDQSFGLTCPERKLLP